MKFYLTCLNIGVKRSWLHWFLYVVRATEPKDVDEKDSIVPHSMDTDLCLYDIEKGKHPIKSFTGVYIILL